MNRSTHPFRYAVVTRERATRAPHARTPFTLDLATWLARLSGNHPLPAPEASRPVGPPLAPLPSWLEDQRQAAD